MYNDIMMKVVNSIFSLAMVLLALNFWSRSGIIVRMLLLIGVLLFPVIQPVLMFFKAKKQLADMPHGLELVFNKKGIEAVSGKDKDFIKWKELAQVSRINHMTIIYLKGGQAFIVADRNLEADPKVFYEFIVSNIRK